LAVIVQKRWGILKLKMEEKHQKRLKEGNADEKGRLTNAVAHYCGT